MKVLFTVVIIVFFVVAVKTYGQSSPNLERTQQATICNSLNLNYRFCLNKPSRREAAADPTMVLYKNKYYLFASKSGGYWRSTDLVRWNLITKK